MPKPAKQVKREAEKPATVDQSTRARLTVCFETNEDRARVDRYAKRERIKASTWARKALLDVMDAIETGMRPAATANGTQQPALVESPPLPR